MKLILLTLKYGGRSVVCGRLLKAGEEAFWQPGIGIAHPYHFSPEKQNVVLHFHREVFAVGREEDDG